MGWALRGDESVERAERRKVVEVSFGYANLGNSTVESEFATSKFERPRAAGNGHGFGNKLKAFVQLTRCWRRSARTHTFSVELEPGFAHEGTSNGTIWVSERNVAVPNGSKFP